VGGRAGPAPGAGRGADAAPRLLPMALRHQQLALISWAAAASDGQRSERLLEEQSASAESRPSMRSRNYPSARAGLQRNCVCARPRIELGVWLHTFFVLALAFL